jgi:hypothetical protein
MGTYKTFDSAKRLRSQIKLETLFITTYWLESTVEKEYV